MTMKRLCMFCVVMLMTAVSMANVFASPVYSMRTETVTAVDGEDGDLYLDCFENAVKDKDMELAAKIANVLYGMEMNSTQMKRFSAIEDKISKKDYRVYRDKLKDLSSKPKVINDNSRYAENDDVYVEVRIDGTSSFALQQKRLNLLSSIFSSRGVD